MSKRPAQSLASELDRFISPFRVDGASRFHLRSHKTAEKGGLDKDKGEKIIEANRKRLNDFQERLYAQDRWSLLLIFQGMDAAGKDSAIKSIFEGVNPQGCDVHSFKAPSACSASFASRSLRTRRRSSRPPSSALGACSKRRCPGSPCCASR